MTKPTITISTKKSRRLALRYYTRFHSRLNSVKTVALYNHHVAGKKWIRKDGAWIKASEWASNETNDTYCWNSKQEKETAGWLDSYDIPATLSR